MEIFSAAGFAALLQVIAIDLVLAGDNAIVIGLAAAGLPADQRKKAIIVGIAVATVMRIGFALITQQLLQVGPILLIGGGALLLYVCWKMWRELRGSHHEAHVAEDALDYSEAGNSVPVAKAPRKTFAQAAWQIVIADVSMSLDNVLAVAGAAMDHPTVLIIGLALSIALMGFAASFIARLLHKHRWIAYIGLLVILYVAIEMTLKGMHGQWPEHFAFLDFWFGGK
ncbi:MAG: TerC family protein [Rhizobiaceae bacterium]|nr:TerC family protein [Rhizobiaceae bacterium]